MGNTQGMDVVVYVVTENHLDFIKAERFGEVRFLTLDRRDDFNNIGGSLNNRHLMASLRQLLADFREDKDFIILTGSQYVCAAVMLILGNKRLKKVKFLRWDNREMGYIPLTLEP